MKTSNRLIVTSSGIAMLSLVASLAFAAVDKTAPQPKCVGKDCAAANIAAEPDKGPSPKCTGKGCGAALPAAAATTNVKHKSQAAAGATVNKANKGAAKVRQATGGDDGGGDGGLKSKAALSKGAAGKAELAPPPPGNVNKAMPKTQMNNAESPRDPASAH